MRRIYNGDGLVHQSGIDWDSACRRVSKWKVDKWSRTLLPVTCFECIANLYGRTTSSA